MRGANPAGFEDTTINCFLPLKQYIERLGGGVLPPVDVAQYSLKSVVYTDARGRPPTMRRGGRAQSAPCPLWCRHGTTRRCAAYPCSFGHGQSLGLVVRWVS